MEDLIIIRLETKHWTYAREQRREDALPEERQTLENQVIKFFVRKNMIIQSDNVVARRNDGAKPAILVRFVNQKHKAELLRQAKKLKGTGLYTKER